MCECKCVCVCEKPKTNKTCVCTGTIEKRLSNSLSASFPYQHPISGQPQASCHIPLVPLSMCPLLLHKPQLTSVRASFDVLIVPFGFYSLSIHTHTHVHTCCCCCYCLHSAFAILWAVCVVAIVVALRLRLSAIKRRCWRRRRRCALLCAASATAFCRCLSL